MGRPPKVMPPRRPNPISRIKPIRNPTPVLHNPTSLARKAAETAAAAGASKAKPRLCPNKECSNPQIEDGICHNCGTIIDDSNIVAEVQFGESSSGAAVVQGSFISAESGTAKSLGPAFRKAGGSEDRESTIREGESCVIVILEILLKRYMYRQTDHEFSSITDDCSRTRYQQCDSNFQALCHEQLYPRSKNGYGCGCLFVHSLSQGKAL